MARKGKGDSSSSNYKPGQEWRLGGGDQGAAISDYYNRLAAWNPMPSAGASPAANASPSTLSTSAEKPAAPQDSKAINPKKDLPPSFS